MCFSRRYTKVGGTSSRPRRISLTMKRGAVTSSFQLISSRVLYNLMCYKKNLIPQSSPDERVNWCIPFATDGDNRADQFVGDFGAKNRFGHICVRVSSWRRPRCIIERTIGSAQKSDRPKIFRSLYFCETFVLYPQIKTISNATATAQ